MKSFVFGLCMVVGGASASAASLMDVIQERLGVDLTSMTVGEKLSPKQAPQAFQAPQMQAPQKLAFQAPQKAELQAPQKVSAVRAAHACTLIPGRARRLERRSDRIERHAAALAARQDQAALQGRRTFLETDGGRTVMESGACTSCNSGGTVGEMLVSTSVTRLTTRELLEGGSIPQTRATRTINEPGVCGGGGSGGRRGIFRRR